MRRKRKLFLVWALSSLVLVAVGGIGLSSVSAYESYHDPSQDDVGYCTTCHAGFAGGPADTLHALHTGGTSSLGTITTNCNLCQHRLGQ